ncbi:ribosome maturation factor RimM [Phyllobacterium sp. 0TCS1.6A]|uniref:ribosome maturation factor RimM n=1 Tax=Phyllobacterium sp. 0TCS1.6A TaxID=2995637 RepID=UPI0022640F68|nr:ribosome maturation factor RimM [Phyllobacterium sp. 0TCS1.6A]MCX8293233.1 ribosome maturation factor RimM [Phyllobacterium sp. 0TCS1.6A]
MKKLNDPVQLAIIGAAHGTRGELRVKTFTEDALAIADYGPLYDATGRAFEILDIRPAKTVVVVRFRGVNDRNAAEALNGTELFVDRSQLPADLDEDEYYHSDLIGLDALDAQGQRYGRISAMFDFGGGDLIELTIPGKRPMLIPFTQAAVPHVDLAAGHIIVDPVAAGLLPDADDDEERRRQLGDEGKPRS